MQTCCPTVLPGSLCIPLPTGCNLPASPKPTWAGVLWGFTPACPAVAHPDPSWAQHILTHTTSGTIRPQNCTVHHWPGHGQGMGIQPVLMKEYSLAGHAMQYQSCWDEATAWQRQAHGTPLYGLIPTCGWLDESWKEA